MWDIHTHCSFSGDSTEPPENMIEAAISRNLGGICFTDHTDLDYPSSPNEDDFVIDYDEYFKKMAGLKSSYEDRIEVRAGVELGLQRQGAAENAQLLEKYPFDLCIGSVHVVDGKDPYYPGFFDGRSEKEAFSRYFEVTVENLRAFKGFDVLGHLGYITRYAPNRDDNYDPKDYADHIDTILNILIDNGIGLELNTSGIRGGLREGFPARSIFDRYRQLGGEIVTTGSDAHNAGDVAADFDRARETLVGCGFKYYAVYKDRKPEFYRL